MVLRGLLKLVSNLFNIEFIENIDTPAWEGEITIFDIYRDKSLVRKSLFRFREQSRVRGVELG